MDADGYMKTIYLENLTISRAQRFRPVLSIVGLCFQIIHWVLKWVFFS